MTLGLVWIFETFNKATPPNLSEQFTNLEVSIQIYKPMGDDLTQTTKYTNHQTIIKYTDRGMGFGREVN